MRKVVLDHVTNVFVIATCILAMYVLTKTHILDHQDAKSKSANHAPPGDIAIASIGQKLDIPGLTPSQSPVNVIAFLSTDCRYCIESFPFYRRLLKRTTTISKHIRMFAVFRQHRQSVTEFLADKGTEGMVVIPSFNPKEGIARDLIIATPTLIVTDQDGRIVQTWIGMVTEEKEREVLNLITEVLSEHSQ
jgi:hypothetical protein